MAMPDPTKKPGDADPQGMLVASMAEGLSPVNDLALSLKPGGGVFSQAPAVSGSGPSTTWHACLGEPWDESGLESPWSLLSCSSIWQC